jgi:hypothetical protein
MQWKVYWSPEGRCIATVEAKTARAAKRKAPMPYRKYLGEIYVELLAPPRPDTLCCSVFPECDCK